MSEQAQSVVVLKTLLTRPVAFHRCFVDLAGSITAAVMLSQMFYWQQRCNESGWFWKTRQEWEDETGLTRREQETARKRLVCLGFVEEKLIGVPATMNFRLDMDAVCEAVMGKARELSVDQIIEIYGSVMAQLSVAGQARASKMGLKVEAVDYCEVLREHGAVCHFCGKPITSGPSSKKGGLQFDHVTPLAEGGSHTRVNIKPSHAECNMGAGHLVGYAIANRKVTAKQTGALCASQPYKESETTTETTAESNSFSLRSRGEEEDLSAVEGKKEPKSKTDPRFSVVMEAVKTEWGSANPTAPSIPWNGREAGSLAQMLRGNPNWPTGDLVRCVENRFASEVNHSERPGVWIPKLTDYFNGPLDRFNKPYGQQKSNDERKQQQTRANIIAGLGYGPREVPRPGGVPVGQSSERGRGIVLEGNARALPGGKG